MNIDELIKALEGASDEDREKLQGITEKVLDKKARELSKENKVNFEGQLEAIRKDLAFKGITVLTPHILGAMIYGFEVASKIWSREVEIENPDDVPDSIAKTMMLLRGGRLHLQDKYEAKGIDNLKGNNR